MEIEYESSIQYQIANIIQRRVFTWEDVRRPNMTSTNDAEDIRIQGHGQEQEAALAHDHMKEEKEAIQEIIESNKSESEI